MIKFVLGLITLVFVGLAVYVYTDKGNKPPKVTTVHKTVKQETPSKKEVSVPEPKTGVKTEKMVKHVVKEEDRKVETTLNGVAEVSSSEEIGKSLTLEGIENADVSDEENEMMRDDLAYYESLHAEPSEPLSDEELLKMIEKDQELGQI